MKGQGDFAENYGSIQPGGTRVPGPDGQTIGGWEMFRPRRGQTPFAPLSRRGVKGVQKESDPFWCDLSLTDHRVAGPGEDDAALKGLGLDAGAAIAEREARSPPGAPALRRVRRVR